jgi:hypothetical protein
MTSHKILKVARQIHLYTGIFLSPAILFFALTGALQSFSLHETSRGSDYKPSTWIVTLSQLHKHQTITVPVRKPRPASDAPKPDAPKPPAPPEKTHLPMKIFFLLVAIGLFISTLTGIYMSYKFIRNRLIVTALLLAGIIVPLILLRF